MSIDKGSFFLEGNNNQGVLLCHGLTRFPEDLKPLGLFLNSLGFTVSCIEYSGHGTDAVNFLNTGVKQWFEDIENAYNDLLKKVEGVFVIGHSMGGAFAAKLAQKYEPLGLVTINAPLIGFPLKERIERLTNNDKKHRNHLRVYDNFIINIGQIINLKKITSPLLVIQGELDTDRFKISSSMLTEYTSSKYKSRIDFKKSGHMVTAEEEKDELNDLIGRFLYEIISIFH